MMAPIQRTSFLVLAVCCTILYHVNAGVIDRTQEDWINSLKSDQLDNDEIESLSIDDAHVDKDLDQELDSIESKRSAGSNNAGNDGVSAGEIIAAINEKHREEIHVKIVDGDIAVKTPTGQDDELEKKSALRYTGRLWQDRKVHYVFDASISASVRSQIQKAMAEYENKTCLRFFLATNTALIKNWIKFTKKSGCWSYVGRTGGQQEISIGAGCSGIGTIIHELMHAMGFYHEQSRYDRDRNIEVLWENIPKANEHNFLKHSSTKVQLQGTVYDFNSIMQYGNKAFSKNGKDTLRSIKNPGRLLGQRSGFSTLDAQEINILYQCKKAGAGFSEWSDWGPCLNDRSTGNLYIKRQKYCFETNRSLCPGASTRGVIEDRQPVSCANTTCVVDGHWSRWSEWGACTKSCGLGGQRTRTRKCTDPVPKCGGAACVGVSSQTGNCYRGRCDLGPDDCEFERSKNPTCHWNQTGSTLHWRIHTGPTPSSNTGPNGDASVNTNGAGYYMYVETSYPVVKDQIGIMSSKSFPPTNNRTITFKYAMGGQTIRYLKVNKVDNNGTKTQLFRKNGHQSFLWLPASISFASPVNYTIQFEMQAGDDYRSDVAVDDIFFADACSTTPCKNGGSCTVLPTGEFKCACTVDWTGLTCETSTNPCIPSPCKNGGSCTAVEGIAQCSCMPGYTGATCETQIDNCASNPCKNGGACTNGVDSYTCTCAVGFTGRNCKINIDDCSQNPCLNGGTCADGVNSFTCTCAAGFTGSTCATNIDDCASKPCQNGGTCTDGVNSFTCTCAAGFTGSTCATNIDDCSQNPCLNGGTCADGVNSFTCTCAAGFTGSTCATNIDDCASKPCKNGGTCTDGVNTFTCTCAAGWTGSTCTQLIDNCVPNPCKNGGTCSNGVNSFTCKCAKGWEGATCTTVMTPPPPTPTTMTTTKAPTTRPPGNFVDLLSCDFECGFCSWKQKKSDVFDWTRQRGKTYSHYTGPSNDHTTAKSGYYLYTEASAPRKPNHNAILTSPTMQSDGTPRCVDLFYHMFGSGIGSLVVSATYNGVAHEVFRTDGNKGNKWNHGKGTLNVPSGLDFTVSIESVQGSSLIAKHWEGDTAIDDIRVWPGACPASSSTPSVLACPIERKSFCSWTQPTTDDGNWRQRTSKKNGYWWLFGDASTDKSDDATATATSTDKSNDATATATSTDKSSDATATNNEVDDPRRRGSKGPRRALSGKRDHYAYFRGRKRSNTENAILQSAAFSATKQSCMRFFAHMSGRKIGSLAVNKVDPLGAKTQLSKHTGNQKNRWFESAVTIPAGQNFKIDIVATQGRKATIAIDDITVSPGRCDMPKIKFRCDFSAGACGLQQNHDDHCDWSIVSSNGGKSLQWKANDCHGDGDSGDEYFALLSKEARVPTRGGCVTIDFHLGKGDVCELEVRLLKDDGSKRGNKKRSHNDEDRIYYRKAKSRNGKKQTIRATIPPPRGGCPMKLIELEAILSEGNYWYGKRCKEVNIDEITFREGICGNN